MYLLKKAWLWTNSFLDASNNTYSRANGNEKLTSVIGNAEWEEIGNK